MNENDTRVRHKIEMSVYKKSGIIYSAGLEANTGDGLKKLIAIKKEEHKDDTEYISFYGHRIELTTPLNILDEKVLLVDIDEMTNPYISDFAKENLKKEIK